jgi:penicillin-binding protein-related factor A (putative recombinase)
MKESNFASEIKKACDYFNIFYCKIPDAYGMERFSPPKPFDSFLINDGTIYCLEFKMIKTKTAFPFDKVKGHQIKGLYDAYKNGAFSYVIVNYRMKRYNKAFYIPIDEFYELKHYATRKSIPFKEIEKWRGIERIKTDNGYFWDVRSF